MVNVRARIFQIIRWEEKEKYFFSTDFGNEPVDLLHIAPIEQETPHWYQCGAIGMIWWFFAQDKADPPFKYRNISFMTNITWLPDDPKPTRFSHGLPILVARPNKYEVGDEITFDIAVTKVRK